MNQTRSDLIPLLQAFGFTSDDLEANRRGNLSEEQLVNKKDVLQVVLEGGLPNLLFLVLIMVILIWGTLDKGTDCLLMVIVFGILGFGMVGGNLLRGGLILWKLMQKMQKARLESLSSVRKEQFEFVPSAAFPYRYRGEIPFELTEQQYNTLNDTVSYCFYLIQYDKHTEEEYSSLSNIDGIFKNVINNTILSVEPIYK